MTRNPINRPFTPPPLQRKFIFGILVALIGARLWLDFSPLPAALPLAMGVGFWLGWIWSLPRWTIFGLLMYAAAPVPLPDLAIMGLALMAAGWNVYALSPFDHESGSRLRIASFIRGWAVVMALALLVYRMTLAPGMVGADGGEFQLVAGTWGIAHPPGFPLYAVAVNLIARLLPLETVAWRVNFFSALMGAMTVGVVAYTARRETGRSWAGWAAGLTLMVSASFWLYSTQASIRPMTALFTALMLEAVLAYRCALLQQRSTTLALIRFGLAAGFGVTHHGSIVFIGLVLAAGIAAVDRSAWRKWGIAIAAALLGALPWLYFIFNADGYLAPDDLDSWDGFWYFVLARGFGGDMLAFAAPEYWESRWWVLRETLHLQWHTVILLLAVLGLLRMLRRDRWLGSTLVAAIIVHLIIAITYRSPQTVQYAIPAYVLIAFAVGWLSVQFFPGRIPEYRGRLQTAPYSHYGVLVNTALLIGLFYSFYSGWVTARRFAASEEARHFAVVTLDNAPLDAVILAQWHRATPLWYLQKVENERPDLEIVYLAPQGGLNPMDSWALAVQSAVEAGQAVVITQRFPEAYRHLPLTFSGEAVLTTPPPAEGRSENIPVGEHGLSPDWAWIETNPNRIHAGEHISLRLTWHLAHPVDYGGLKTFIHLGAPDAPPLAQVDLALQAPVFEYESGEVVQFYDLLIPATVPPGDWSILVGAYTPDGELLINDQVRYELTQIHVQPALFPLPTQHSIHRRFEGATLRGWDYDTTRGDEVLLYLHWHLTGEYRPYTVSIQDREGGMWSPVTAAVDVEGGYWTSVHILPRAITEGGVKVQLGDQTAALPPLRGEQHYILFGNVAALVDWKVDIQPDQVVIETEWLPLGATYVSMNLSMRVIGEGWEAPGDFTPVSGQIQTYEWVFNRAIRSQHTIEYEANSPPQEVRFIMYDGFTGQVVFITDTTLIGGVPLYLAH